MRDASKTLWYREPARAWTEALPVGNGRLGAMIFGGVQRERLALNEATLWSGGPKAWNNPQAKAILPQVRQALFAGEYAKADALCREMQGPFNQSYQPLGNLYLEFTGANRQQNDYLDYYRELDLDRAVASVRYEQDGAIFDRQVFASFPAQVIVVRLTCSQPRLVSFNAKLDSLLRHTTRVMGPDSMALAGKCPAHVEPSYVKSSDPIRYDDGPDGEGMTFEIHLRVLAEGGTITGDDSDVRVAGADAVTLLVSAATSFNGYDKSPTRHGQNPAELAASYLAALKTQSYEALERQHTADHRQLFDRVTFNLDAPSSADLPATDERIRTFGQRSDPQLPALLFHYGRYLMIASSRPGGQPANLQGLWNDLIRPPWSSNWTININTQMNYWPAEVCNLAECHEPLLDFIAELAVNGQKTAEINYGARGWVAHHNADLWRQSAPVGNYGAGDPVWANWPMGGAWLCQHLWEHFAFNGDLDYLRNKAYPLMKGAAEFCLDWLIDDGQGHLTTAPSVSPELHFLAPDGQPAAASMGATMDISIIRDLFTNCIQAASLLHIDAQFAHDLRTAIEKLIPFQIGSRGQLQEWATDFQEEDVHHRHMSQLYAVYPAHQITMDATPDLAAAAHRVLELRGDESTGWSQAWKINLYARLRDPKRAYWLVRHFFTLIDDAGMNYGHGGGVYANLFDAHPPFQIDGNFGYSAGIVEMLLQSHADEIYLLPALPQDWPSGRITGVCARGGFEIAIQWADHRLVECRVRSTLGGVCRVRTKPVEVVSDGERVPVKDIASEGIEFLTVAGKEYHIQPAGKRTS